RLPAQHERRRPRRVRPGDRRCRGAGCAADDRRVPTRGPVRRARHRQRRNATTLYTRVDAAVGRRGAIDRPHRQGPDAFLPLCAPRLTALVSLRRAARRMSCVDTPWPTPSEKIKKLIRSGAEVTLNTRDEFAEELRAAALGSLGVSTFPDDPGFAENARRINLFNLLHWASSNIQEPGGRVSVP